jgi:decaprenyl-diphosphate synthase subunit 2
MAESNFVGERDDQNTPLPSDPSRKIYVENLSPLDDFNYYNRSIDMDEVMGYPEREWTFRHTLSSASLLGKSCQGTLQLAGHSEEMQKKGYLFGKHLALAWQANMDLEPFRPNEFAHASPFSLISAPVLFHLEEQPSLYKEIEKGSSSVDAIDFQKVHEAVLGGSGIDKTKDLQIRHGQIAMNVLNEFPTCDAKIALQNIIGALLLL